ncbi:MAG: CvpA family protein [Clostridiales bacterium]|nr:CvpA family protein [Clostridiales bacterium]
MSDPIKVDFSDKGKGKGNSSTKEVLIPPEKAGLKIVLSLLITIVAGAIVYYFMLPPMNFSAIEFYMFWAVVLAIFIASNFVLSKAFIKPEYVPYVKRVSIAPIIIALILAVVLLVGYLTSCVLFRAKSYTELLSFNDDVEFSQSVTKIDSTSDFSSVAMIDTDAASKLADKVLGELATRNLESQFDIATEYSTQINYKGSPCRVYPLKYGNIFKWINNTSDGFPGYVIVNMNTQETEFYFLTEDDTTEGYMKYSPTEHFQKNLKRIVRFNYPTALIGNISFEIDDDNTPYWICEVLEKKVGLIGGDDVKGIVLVNAVTGELSYHDVEEVAAEDSELTWIDQVYDASLLVEQYNYYGTYNNGFWNSLFGQTGVKKTTTGSSYIAMNDDVYIYTGVTSVTSDESILGFILINQRTKEANFYNISGATESSAQSSAQGALSDKGWTATFPLLINLDGEPTYFMAMKDSNSVVKSYAMVNVGNYNIVGTDSADGNPSLTQCINNYATALKDSKNTVINVDTSVEPELVTDNGGSETETAETTLTGAITDIKSQSESGTTCYYILTTAADKYIKVSADDMPEAIFLEIGDIVTVTYDEADESDNWIEASEIDAGTSSSVSETTTEQTTE